MNGYIKNPKWQKLPGQRQAKQTAEKQRPEFIKDLQSKDRKMGIVD